MHRGNTIILPCLNAVQIADLFEGQNGFPVRHLLLKRLAMHDLVRICTEKNFFLIEILEPALSLVYALRLALSPPRVVEFLAEGYVAHGLDIGVPMDFVDISKIRFSQGPLIQKLFLIYPETLPYSA